MKPLALLLFSVSHFLIFSTVTADELKNLTEAYEREKLRVLSPVERKYTDALNALLQRYTQAGRLKEANSVQSIIDARGGGGLGDWLREEDTKWNWQSGGTLTLYKNQKANHSQWKKPGKWIRVRPDTLEMTNGVGRVFTIKFHNRNSATVIGPDNSATVLKRKI